MDIQRQKSIMLYFDQFDRFDELEMSEKGEMITAIIDYAKNGVIKNFEDRTLRVIFKDFKKEIDRDAIKYAKKCEANRENGKKGGRPKNPNKPNGLHDNPKEPTKPQTPNTEHNKPIPIDKTPNTENNKQGYFGLYNNVFLSNTDYESLKKDFPEDWKERIESVSEWYHQKSKVCINGAEQARKWIISPHQYKNENKENINNEKSPYSSLEPDILTDEEMNEIERLYNG